MIYAHKTRLHVNNVQANFLQRCCGMRRVAYNWALAEWKRQYDVGEKPHIADIDKRFNRWKQEHREEKPWLYAVPSCCGQQAIKYDLKSPIGDP